MDNYCYKCFWYGSGYLRILFICFLWIFINNSRFYLRYWCISRDGNLFCVVLLYNLYNVCNIDIDVKCVICDFSCRRVFIMKFFLKDLEL